MITLSQYLVSFFAVFVTVVAIVVIRHYSFLERLMRMAKLPVKQFIFHSSTKGKTFSYVDHYESMVDQSPDAQQLIFAETGESRTRRQVDNLANQVAHWAMGLGVSEGDIAALMLLNQLDYPSIWMGLSKIGVSTSLINTNTFGQPFQHSVTVSLKDSKCRLLIVDEELREKLRGELDKLTDVKIFYWGTAPSCLNMTTLKSMSTQRIGREKRKSVLAESSLLYIFTSGTTGLPKACKIMQKRYYLGSHFYPIMARLTPDDVIYCPLPLYHSAGGILGVGAALTTGCVFVMRKKFSASLFAKECVQYKVTTVQYIGELCRYLCASPPTPYDSQVSLRSAFGNGLRPDSWPTFQRRYGVKDIVEFYAATEGNIALVNCFNHVGAIGYIPPVMKRVFPAKIVKVEEEDSSVPLRDARGRCVECAEGEPGLLIAGISQSARFEGYTDAKETEKKVLKDVFVKGDKFFNTGDLLSRDKDGYFFWYDRVGDTFRYKGENVSTTEVALPLSSLVTDLVVYPVPLPNTEGKAGMVCVVPQPSSPLDMDEFTSTCFSSLPPYAVPLFVRVKGQGEKIPVTSTYKNAKKELEREGFDPSACSARDTLYYLDTRARKFVKLTAESYVDIKEGRIKF